jgi:hypothetical protein
MFGTETLTQIEKKRRALQNEIFKMFEGHFTQDKIVKDIAHRGYCRLHLKSSIKDVIDEKVISVDFKEWFSANFDENIFKYEYAIFLNSNSLCEIKIYLK